MNHILLMEGPDSEGLVFHVTNVLYKNNCNILRQDEFVSTKGGFFMRTEFVGNDKIDIQAVLDNLREAIPNPKIVFRLSPKTKKNIIILATKEHHCLADQIIRCHFKEINANILAVISNYDVLEPLVSKFDIPFHTVSHLEKSRENHEIEIMEIIEKYHPDFLVLAKYMRILSPNFVKNYKDKIINIHHSFLPAFIGANPYKQAYERGVKLIGATAHFVTNDLDEGPIISQNTKKVNHRYTAKDMSREGKEVEKTTLTKALQLVFNDRVFIDGNKTIIL